MRILVLTAFVIHFCFSASAADDLVVAEFPDWVVIHDYDDSPAEDDEISNGQQVLLTDQQFNYSLDAPGQYSREVARAITADGVQRVSLLHLSYYSEFQTYNIHRIRVYRDGEEIDYLGTSKVRVVKQDTGGIDHSVATTQLAIYLGDIRRGDIIDLAATIYGERPDFLGRVIGSFVSGGLTQIRQVERRLIVKRSTRLSLEYFGGHPEAEKNRRGVNHEYSWSISPFLATKLEDGVPAWFVQVPTVAFSDFRNWKQVVRWGLKHFPEKREVDEAVQAQAKSVTEGTDSDIERLQRILQFMQSDVRYEGEDLGRSGYRPFLPQQVLEQRYGDCKDQSVLMVGMLRAAGVEAWPALVHNEWTHATSNRASSPSAFNHSIVYARIGDKDYWMDPTLTLEEDRYVSLEPVPYGKALVLRAGEAELTDIPNPLTSPGRFTLEVTTHIEPWAGLDRPGIYSVDSVYYGNSATIMRQVIESMGEEKLSDYFEALYSFRLGGATELEPLQIQGSYADGSLATTHEFEMEEPWVMNASKGRWQFTYTPYSIEEIVDSDFELDRESPLSIAHLGAIKQELTFRMPPGWSFDSVDFEFESEFFQFRIYDRVRGNMRMVSYEFRTKSDHVPAEKIGQFADDLDEVKGHLKYYIWVNSPDEAKIELDDLSVSIPKEEPKFEKPKLERPKIEPPTR